MLARLENSASPCPLSVNSAKRLACELAFLGAEAGSIPPNKESCPLPFFGAGASVGELAFSRLNTLSVSVRNSISSKIFRSASSSGVSRFNSCKFSSMGTSVLMVARNLEKVMSSLLVSTFVFKAPFNWSVLANNFSMLPNWAISFCAVFSPTPGQPGILSDESPIKPSISITCKGDSMSNLAFTCSMPITSNSLSPYLGRYIKTFSLTS